MRASFEYISRFTGQPCICVLTGVDGESANAKTGGMAQVWFLLRVTPPHEAVKERRDSGVCGACPLRGGRGCYVRTEQAPLAIWHKWRNGGYREELAPGGLPAVRFGAYGDPASVPARTWKAFMNALCPERWTGYTHGWRRAPWLRRWCMASVEYEGDGQKAYAQGWSVFESVPPDRENGVRTCANVTRGTQCAQCLRCDGAHEPHGQRWIQIPAHGAKKRRVHGNHVAD